MNYEQHQYSLIKIFTSTTTTLGLAHLSAKGIAEYNISTCTAVWTLFGSPMYHNMPTSESDVMELLSDELSYMEVSLNKLII